MLALSVDLAEEDGERGAPAPTADPAPARRQRVRREPTRTAGVSKLRRRKGVVYEARWRARDPDTGEWTGYSGTFPKLEEAEAHLDEQRHARRTGAFIPPSKGRTTFAEVFAGREEALRIKGRKEDTLAGYRRVADTWLREWWHRPVAGIGRVDVQAIMARMRKAGRKPQTMHNTFNVIHGTFKHAVRTGCIAVNPAAGEREEMLPSAGRTNEPTPLTAGQVEALASLLPTPYGLLVRFTAWSGLRAAEIVGLRVQDVLVLHAEVHVVQAVHRRGGEVHVGTPKSKKSTGRHVPIPPTLARQLAEHVAEHGLGPDNYVFTVNGEPVNYSSFYKHIFKRAVRELGMPTLRFHDLRHTFAALKLGQGYGIHEVKEWMGHATVNTTVDLYGKWVRGDEDGRRAKDDAAFLAVQPSSVVVPLRSRAAPATG